MPGISAGLGGQINNNIQTDGLVFYIDSAYKKSYPGSGTTWNDLGGSNNGTLTNGPTFTDKSVVFDGSNDYVDFGDIGVANAYHFSIWFYLESSVDSSTSNYGLFRNENIDQAGVHFGAITYATNPTLSFLYNESSAFYWGGTPYYRTYIRDNFAAGWHYVSFNWNSNKYDIYVNADSKTTYASTHSSAINIPLSGTAAGHVPLMTMDEFRLGRGQLGSSVSHFDGRIQVVQIYDKSLTASEIKQNYDASKERFGL